MAARVPVWSPRTVTLLGWLGAVALVAVMLDGRVLWHELLDGYMLMLTLSALCLVLASAKREARGGWSSAPAFGWLRSFGRLSYEIYLTHMFVVVAVVRLFKATGSDIALGYLWYVPAVLLSWLLGLLVARYISIPCDRALRALWLKPNRQADYRQAVAVETVMADVQR